MLLRILHNVKCANSLLLCKETMNCEVVRSVVAALPADSEFSMPSPKVETAKELARAILIYVEKNKEQFSVFCDCMVSKIGAACTLDGSLKKHSSRRERMWRSFHSLCVNELPPMWNKFLADTGITDVDDSSLVTQHINLKIFEGMLKKNTRIEQVESEIPLITQDEANALRYAAGYVPFALKKRFSKRPEIVTFLSSLGKEGIHKRMGEACEPGWPLPGKR